MKRIEIKKTNPEWIKAVKASKEAKKERFAEHFAKIFSNITSKEIKPDSNIGKPLS